MLQKMPELCGKLGITIEQHSIYQQSSGSFFKPLSSDAKGVEGFSPCLAVNDELHVAKDRELFENLQTACEKRDNSLFWIITTAGNNRAGICFDQHEYVEKLLNGVYENESYFGIIYCPDAKDDLFSELAWKKANPSYGNAVSPETIFNAAHKAKQHKSSQASFFTKHCNVWVSVSNAWMDMLRFQQCADPDLSIDSFKFARCVIGLDLASSLDLLAKVNLFWKQINGKRHYYAFGTYWTNALQAEASDNSYKAWAEDGLLNVCEGNSNDYSLVEDAIKQDCKTFQVLEVAHDPWSAAEMTNHLSKEGIKMVAIPQNDRSLISPAMRELESAVYDGRFHYTGDPILAWAMSNVIAKANGTGELLPSKSTGKNKIDPVSALLDAIIRVTALSVSGEAEQNRRTKMLVFEDEPELICA